MTQLVNSFTALLRTELTPPVEKYWRPGALTTLTLFVHPASQSAEEGISIGNVFGEDFSLDVFIETPWDNKEATAEAVDAVIEDVKTLVHNNRDLEYATGLYAVAGKQDGVEFFMAESPGARPGTPSYGAKLRVTYTDQD